MREGIKPGSGGNEIRHANGEFRIADHDCRQHLWMKDDLLYMACRIGDHRGASHLRAGSCCRWHGDDRRNRAGIGSCPPIANILEIPDRAGLPGHEGNHLSKIKPGASAKGDDAIMATCQIGVDT